MTLASSASIQVHGQWNTSVAAKLTTWITHLVQWHSHANLTRLALRFIRTAAKTNVMHNGTDHGCSSGSQTCFQDPQYCIFCPLLDRPNSKSCSLNHGCVPVKFLCPSLANFPLSRLLRCMSLITLLECPLLAKPLEWAELEHPKPLITLESAMELV